MYLFSNSILSASAYAFSKSRSRGAHAEHTSARCAENITVKHGSGNVDLRPNIARNLYFKSGFVLFRISVGGKDDAASRSVRERYVGFVERAVCRMSHDIEKVGLEKRQLYSITFGPSGVSISPK